MWENNTENVNIENKKTTTLFKENQVFITNITSF